MERRRGRGRAQRRHRSGFAEPARVRAGLLHRGVRGAGAVVAAGARTPRWLSPTRRPARDPRTRALLLRPRGLRRRAVRPEPGARRRALRQHRRHRVGGALAARDALARPGQAAPGAGARQPGPGAGGTADPAVRRPVGSGPRRARPERRVRLVVGRPRSRVAASPGLAAVEGMRSWRATSLEDTCCA